MFLQYGYKTVTIECMISHRPPPHPPVVLAGLGEPVAPRSAHRGSPRGLSRVERVFAPHRPMLQGPDPNR